MMSKDHEFMLEAIKEALKAYRKEEVPVGAVVVLNGEIIGKGHNQRETVQLTKAHAEMIAIEEASKTIGSWKLDGASMYVTLEPCPMCAGAILQSRIRNVYYGTTDYKNGSKASGVNVFSGNFSHKVNVIPGILEEENKNLLKKFFKTLRSKKYDV